jgi:MFS family permease
MILTDERHRAATTIIGGVAFLQFGHTLFAVLLPLQLALAGAAAATVAAVATAYGLGFLLGCLHAHRLIRAVGHIRAFAALSALCALTSLAFTLSDAVLVWLPLRLAQGLCLAGLYTTAEGWLAAATPAERRGGVIAVYLVATKLVTIAAQSLLGTGALTATTLIVLASATFTAALVPVALTPAQAPPSPALRLVTVRELVRIAPAAVAGCLAAGLLNAAVINLTPLYGTRAGLGVALTTALLSLMQLGSLLVQWPLGRLSDRVDRRLVLAGCGGAVVLISLALALPMTPQPGAIAALFLAWGAFSMSIYGIATAHAADFVPPEQMVGVSGGLLFCWASGSAIGPVVAAPFIDLLGPAGLFVYALAVAGGFTGFVLWRRTRRAALPPEARTGFVNLPATSPAIGRIDPRADGEKGRAA